jgi:hypothetical protein
LLGVLRARAETTAIDCRAFPYTLVYRRSFFKVTVTFPPEVDQAPATATAPAPPTSPAPAAPETPQSRLLSGAAAATTAQPAAARTSTRTQEITTPQATLGPGEHWIFSVDFSLPVTDFDLGTQPTADEKRLNQKDFFIALNLALGDLLVDRRSVVQNRPFWRDLLIKVQVTPSKTPWESWAVGVGLRGARPATVFWNFDVVHPYFTFGSQTDDIGVRHWRGVFGLGFDPRSLVK